jgi:hypothetical protein
VSGSARQISRNRSSALFGTRLVWRRLCDKLATATWRLGSRPNGVLVLPARGVRRR